jgi:Fur family transcriptional regulator, peroxide stress response regulator
MARVSADSSPGILPECRTGGRPRQSRAASRPMPTMNAAELLRSKGIRPSQQRIRIYESLAASKAHPSAETIFSSLASELPTLSRTTVYSTLDLLARRGLSLRLALTGGELRYDADISPHVHFLCRACRQVFDLPGLGATKPAQGPAGYIVESWQLHAEGLCPRCAADHGHS